MKRRHVGAIALRIGRQFRRDRRSLALLLVVPIVVLTLLAWIFNTPARPASIVVASDSNPQAAIALASSLSAQKGILATTAGEADARASVADRDADAAVIIPANFSPNPTQTHTLTVVVEGSDPQRTSSVLGSLSRALPGAIFQLAGLTGSPIALQVEYLHGGQEYGRLDSFAPVYIAFFIFFFVYLLTSVSFLRERISGSFERLLVSPLSHGDIVVGYMLGFTFFAAIQSVVVVFYVVFVLRINHEGNIAWVIVITLILAVGAVNLGITLSAFARTELQVVQFIPLAILPQTLLSGVIFPVADLPRVLRLISHLLPLTYANDALRGVMLRGEGFAALWPDIAALAGFAVLMAVLGSTTLRAEQA